MATLLAVDLGVKTGLALYDQDGRLLWYRSHNFGTAERLRRGARQVLGTLPQLAWLGLEGGGPLAEIWRRQHTPWLKPGACSSPEKAGGVLRGYSVRSADTLQPDKPGGWGRP